jgi:hypothetical protein
MKPRHHLRLWLLATAVWAGFLVAGLPDYYQQYSPVVMIGFEVLLLVPISLILYVVLKRVPPGRRMSLSLWIALYFTVPLAVYDFLYCGVILGRGIAFLWKFWYLSVYYVVPWLLGPAIVWLVRRTEASAAHSRRTRQVVNAGRLDGNAV